MRTSATVLKTVALLPRPRPVVPTASTMTVTPMLTAMMPIVTATLPVLQLNAATVLVKKERTATVVQQTAMAEVPDRQTDVTAAEMV